MHNYIVWFLCGICFLVLVESVPVPKDIPSADTFEFMRKYGYIPDDGDNSAALFTEDGLETVIKEIQKFGALEQTGKLNNDTLALMRKPRCGVADVLRDPVTTRRTKRFVLGPKGWNKRNITYFIANWSGKLSEDIVARDISLGLDTWGRYGRLTFKRVYSPEADIIVAFGRGFHGDMYPFDGPGNVLAHAFFPYEQESFGGDIHFDDDENWTTDHQADKGTNFFQVAIHELGHSLGLSHSPIPSSVMFPYYTGKGPDNLDYDDILGMYELYIKRRLESDDHYSTSTTASRDYPTSTERYPWTRYTTSDSSQMPEVSSTRRWYHPHSSTTETYQQDSTTTTRTVSYHGDWESVDDHKPHDPTHNIPPTLPPPASTRYTVSPPRSTTETPRPDICEGNYDAVATLRGEIFVFKGKYLWRLRKEYELMQGYPIPFRQMFPMLPEDVTHIDAAYQRPDGNIVLFSGHKFWVYDGRYFVENSPRLLKDLGLPESMKAIDAVQNWARNGKTYFYRGSMIWRYDEEMKQMDEGYPMTMERWRGVPTHLDAATTWKGITYFFKGRCYWKFDNDWIITTKSSPFPTPQTWFGCPKEEVEYCVPPEHNHDW